MLSNSQHEIREHTKQKVNTMALRLKTFHKYKPQHGITYKTND